MPKITASEVKKLRQLSGAGMMEAKQALTEADGDTSRALEILRQRGLLRATKKAERAANSGIIDVYIHDGRIGVMLEVNCETDFVARNEEFKKLVHDLALQIASNAPGTVADLLSQPFIRDPKTTIKELVDQKIALLGENIQVKRFVRYLLGE